ncbi:DUF3010 family protein [Alishewanella sp. HL-SH05]|uniref:DUF3010 family protein n=1 Tax=Alishewanella sp. HL-SH05 TaxID=3461145 RepID=UPI00404357FC
MRVCGIEIKGSEAILCLMNLEDGLFDLPECRVNRIALSHDQLAESVQKFQFAIKKLVEDYKIEHLIIKERPQKGKFAGGAVGFKIEAAIQLISTCPTTILSGAAVKDRIKRHPLPVDFKSTGLKVFQETAYVTAYAFLVN